MTVEQIKNIPIQSVLAQIGFLPSAFKHQGNELWYTSPFRDEKTPSFKLDVKQNLWYDFGAGEGGSVIDFIMQLRQVDFKTALVVLSNEFKTGNLGNLEIFKNDVSKQTPSPKSREKQADIFILKAVKNFPFSEDLTQYIVQNRGIDREVAQRFLKEIHFENAQTGKRFFALGLENRDGGYEIRNLYFKSTVPEKTKSISWIKNGAANTKIICFEGMMDFLSYATLFGVRATEDYLILNSVSFVSNALKTIKKEGYEWIETFFDNDTAGQKATQEFQLALDNVKPQNAMYAPNEDLNAYLMAVKYII